MNLGPTEPFTTGFGAVPRPEEPARFETVPIVAPGTVNWNRASVVNNVHVQPPLYPIAGLALRKTRVNHTFHFLLTVLTCGLWAPVWFFVWVTARQR